MASARDSRISTEFLPTLSALFAGEFGSLERRPGIDQPVVQPQLQPGLGGEPVDAFLRLGPVGRRQHLVAWPALGRDLGVELEWNPFHGDVVFTLQPLDSDRVDVAEGSDVIRIDAHRGRHHPRIAGTIPFSTLDRRLPRCWNPRRSTSANSGSSRPWSRTTP